MRYNIIGDIHGRDSWKQLVKDDAVNIFLGDYLDPYRSEGAHLLKQEWANLHDILRYKHEHPATVLLLGNHDLHYLGFDRCSRYNEAHAPMYRRFFEEHLADFQLAYAIGDKALVTHAGVTREWLDLCGQGRLQRPQEIADMINGLLREPERLKLLSSFYCFDRGDVYGTSPSASPVWVRPETLCECNALPDCVQIVGHTQMREPICVENIYFCDCLGYETRSLDVELKTENTTIN